MEMMEEGEGKGYAWERAVENSWQKLEEDESGQLVKSSVLLATEEQSGQRELTRERKQQDVNVPLRKGIIRYVVVLLDLSKQMDEVGVFRPNCLGAALEGLKLLVVEFLERNPLSYLSIITSKEGKADLLTQFSSSKDVHLSALKKFTTGVDFSLQNGLDLAFSCLKFIPKYFSREIVTIQASLSTCDPGDIFDTVETLQKNNIRCSFVSLSAEVYVCKKTAELTLGDYKVAKNKENLTTLLMHHVNAPVIRHSENDGEATLKSTFMPMGFPSQLKDDSLTVNSSYKFICPKCEGVVEAIPSECSVCGLSLVDSAHLAKSYHHLFPVPIFIDLTDYLDPEKETEEDMEQEVQSKVSSEMLSKLKSDNLLCGACVTWIKRATERVTLCTKCQSVFCGSCDELIHDVLHNCPQCL